VTPPRSNEKTVSGLRRPLALTAVVVLIGMTIFEFLKSFVLPRLTLWQSHTITIFFSTAVATVMAYRVLRHQQREERQRFEVTMRLSEKMSAVGRLAAGVAHEINNPLSVILGFAQALAKNVKEDDPAVMPLRSIEREAVRCKNLAQNLLAFSRHGAVRNEIFELSGAILPSLVLIATQARVKSVQVVQDFQAHGTRIRGDKNQIEQVIINLCGNAIDAMPRGGILTVSSSKVQENGRPFVRIQVKDTGEGIPEAIQGRIFEPFFTTKEPGKGTGLGLALVREMVEKHHGRIDCQSRDGQGTTFTMIIPVVPELSVQEIHPDPLMSVTGA